MKYVRIYADAEGRTHFEEIEEALSAVDFAPPAAPQNVSAFAPASRVGFLSVQPGWFGDWHPVPRRQFLFYLSGEIEIEVGDGELQRFGPGSVLLAEDTHGQGHTTRAVSAVPVRAAVVQLPD
jgi:mannose-6-phosphate isomerase-like protein (cupin superfamily)